MKVGIVGWKSGDGNFFGVQIDYAEYASQFGEVVIITPQMQNVDIDLLILPGGADTNPTNYGQIPGFNNSNPDVYKDFFMKERLKEYIGRIPVVGICLGMQQLNVFLGGTLHQDVKFHDQSSSRWQTAHEVYRKLSPLGTYTVKGPGTFKVNSHHHQGVKLSDLAPGLVPLYYSDTDDGFVLVEAFEHPKLQIFGVQWHPEQLYDAFTINKIKQLLNKPQHV